MRNRLRLTRRRFLGMSAVALMLFLLGVSVANYHVVAANSPRIYSDLDQVPACDVGLVLGASAKLRNGNANLHFEGRMDAAAALYRAGKVRHLLVSGDNHHADYNEPAMMRAALIKRGVPDAAITSDFAGFRTLDSVVRAKQVFGLQRCIIISQHYHNARALEIARANHLDAWGYCASGAGFANSFTTVCREVLARSVTMLDLYVWHRQPHFLGRPEPIRLASR